jgi:dehydrodolichyl diphosphate syntase complex subunit NUS1
VFRSVLFKSSRTTSASFHILEFLPCSIYISCNTGSNLFKFLLMFNKRQNAALRGSRAGDMTSANEREQLLKQFLPETPPSASPLPSRAPSRRPSKNRSRTPRKKPIRTALRHSIHVFLFTAIQFFFGVYLRLRMAWRAVKYRIISGFLYHHRTPELIRSDTRSFQRKPHHLSVILHLNPEEDRKRSIQRLVNEVGELTAWCAAAGIPILSVYEKTGMVVPL